MALFSRRRNAHEDHEGIDVDEFIVGDSMESVDRAMREANNSHSGHIIDVEDIPLSDQDFDGTAPAKRKKPVVLICIIAALVTVGLVIGTGLVPSPMASHPQIEPDNPVAAQMAASANESAVPVASQDAAPAGPITTPEQTPTTTPTADPVLSSNPIPVASPAPMQAAVASNEQIPTTLQIATPGIPATPSNGVITPAFQPAPSVPATLASNTAITAPPPAAATAPIAATAPVIATPVAAKPEIKLEPKPETKPEQKVVVQTPKVAPVVTKATPAPTKPAPATSAKEPASSKTKSASNNEALPTESTQQGEAIRKLVETTPAKYGVRSVQPEGLIFEPSRPDERPIITLVGDLLPNGERLVRVDAKSNTIVTDRTVVRFQ